MKNTDFDDTFGIEERASQHECMSTIHKLIGYIFFIDVVLFMFNMILMRWMMLVYFGAMIVFTIVAIVMHGFTKVYTEMFFSAPTAVYILVSFYLLLKDLHLFFSECDRPYCHGWRWFFFVMYYVALFVNFVLSFMVMRYVVRVLSLEHKIRTRNDKPSTGVTLLEHDKYFND